MDRGFYTKDIKSHSYLGTKKSKQVLLSSLLSSHDFSQVTKDRALRCAREGLNCLLRQISS